MKGKTVIYQQGIGLSPAQVEAHKLHTHIQLSLEMAGNALVEFCRGLKTMRDSKLFKELGINTFEEYAETALNIKQRQAYSYIRAYEELGAEFLQSTAKIGITKLEILAALPAAERAELMEGNAVEDMSAAELRAAVAKLKDKDEEILQLTAKIEELEAAPPSDADEAGEYKAKIAELEAALKLEQEYAAELEGTPPPDISEYETRITELENELAEAEAKETEILQLTAKIKELESAPPAPKVNEAELTARAEALAAERVKAAEARLAEEAKKKIEAEAVAAKAAAAKEKEKLTAELNKAKAELAGVEKIKAEIEQEKARREKLERELARSANPQLLRFKYQIEDAQRQLAALFESAAAMPGEDGKKCYTALAALSRYITTNSEGKI